MSFYIPSYRILCVVSTPLTFVDLALKDLSTYFCLGGDSNHRISRLKLFYNFLMHISSFFIGCKGNDNRFFSVESCVNTCGGNEPETDAKCKDVTCDVSMATFMKAKGCVSKIKPRSKSFTSFIYADLKT